MKTIFNRLTPFQATALLVFVSSVLRLIAANSIELTADETHYALYGLHLDWSYLDHPPLIGWLQAIVLQFSDSDLALRVMPILLFAAASLVLFRVCVTLFPDETHWLGFASVAIVHSSLMFQLIGIAMVPDDPILLLGLLLILALHGVLSDGSLRHWLWLGLWLGLAGLSKYTAVSLIMTVFMALLISRQWSQLRRPGPWLALLVGLLLILPVLYWNYLHDWISFVYQIKNHHGSSNSSWDVKKFIISQARQFMVFGPGIYVFGMIAVFAALKKFKKLGEQSERGVMLCLALALPLLLMFGWNSGYFVTMPHWTLLGWIALSPLAARWIIHSWNRRWVRIGVRSSIVYSVLCIAVVFSQFFSPWMPFPDDDSPLVRDIYGWKQAAQRAEQLRAELAKSEGPVPVILTEEWTQASRLSWYARPTPLQVLDTRYDQFDFWFGSPQNDARGILVLWPGKSATPESAGSGKFAKCSLLERLPIIISGRPASTFSFYECLGYRN